MQPWYLIENEADYQRATDRYEAIREAERGSLDFKEKQLLAVLINHYEESLWEMPDVDPIEFIKIRMEEFGYKASDLAKEYGDKGTVSKVLNYKQALSLTMIRKFSKLLRIPVEALSKEYTLQ
ncbi:MAG: XRE family transcriptional regulator [Sphingobacteriales bacterium 50-39]|nr:helix-turn-helix domain-containing protein [Sphingobacteriales bacterium]OJW57538.1 MAG: XRE family transcriptional regulator [Sphingobacteriales bacterium 50-39]